MGAVRRLVDELRRRGVTVHEWPGWDGRGNEGIGQIDPVGAVLHHTASGYGSAFEALVSGRPDLRGTLCNFAGNADGSLTVVASGLAWHAGRGAGPSLGPLAPWAGWLNRWTVGLEIVYPGDKPMTAAQRAAALVFARAVADLFGGGDIERVRAHAETNGRGGDGKWDPGFAPGQTIDMAAFRREAATAKSSMEVDDVAFDSNSGNVVFSFRNDDGKVEKGVFGDLVGLAAKRAWEIKQGQVAQTALLAEILANTSGDSEFNQGAILERVGSAVEKGTKAAVVETVLPALRTVLLDVLDDDNEDQAQAILDKLGAALTAGA